MMTVAPAECGCCFVAQVTLANGEVAGEGGGPTAESAKFYAVKDALKSENPRYATAGRGHRVFLTEADQALLENYVYAGREAPQASGVLLVCA
jgi:hypothetical protein